MAAADPVCAGVRAGVARWHPAHRAQRTALTGAVPRLLPARHAFPALERLSLVERVDPSTASPDWTPAMVWLLDVVGSGRLPSLQHPKLEGLAVTREAAALLRSSCPALESVQLAAWPCEDLPLAPRVRRLKLLPCHA